MILGAEPVSLVVRSRTRGSDGRTTETTTSTTAITASVQPANGDDLATLPEGERVRKARKFYTETAVSAGPPANRIVVDGETYEIRHVERERSVLAHYKAIGVKVDEASP